MTTKGEPLLAELGSFPHADREAWKTLVAKALEGGDPFEELARQGLDGRATPPLATPEDLPEPLTPPPTWREAPLVNVTFASASEADGWNAQVDEELARGATGIASVSLPEGSREHAEQLMAGGARLFLNHPPTFELEGPWILTFDAVARALEHGDDRDVGASIEAGFGRQQAAMGEGRRHGLVDLGLYARNGASSIQQLGLMLATLAEIGRRCDDHDLKHAAFLARFSVALDLSTDVLESVAKLRAARVLWAKFFGVLEVPSTPWLLARTAERTWSKLDPETNWLRATCQTIAAFLGGADAQRTHEFDRLSSTESTGAATRTARDTVSVLELEGHLGRVRDPARGSYHVEATTDTIARGAWDFFRQLERKGGLAATLGSGFVRAEIARARLERHRRLTGGPQRLIGVNEFRLTSDGPAPEPLVPASVGDWNGLREAAAWEGRR